ncbi:ABC transporter permease [Anoxybacter fermentans]|uniref:ABC transporter permease n=1 Tax=Anoxybacter fermentans TaxID=1323375 RepID=A0A3S9T2P3_9FIRM|nr:ABC transporter permease [Anoxybacter fermentans]
MGYQIKEKIVRFTVYLILTVGAVFVLLPFFWMLSTSLKIPSEIASMPPKWIPSKFMWENYKIAWNAAPFARYFFNSFYVAIACTFLELITSALGAYAFAKMDFFGKNVLFIIFLGTMMIPGEVLLIPNYITIIQLGWVDTYKALIIPWVVSVFGIFLMRQFFLTIPKELHDAAKIDGCSRFRFLWQIIIPLSKPVLITAALFKFVGSWNAFLWVLIVTNTPEMRTVPVGLSFFSSDVGTDYHLLMAASTLALMPILILFFFLQKQFIQGITRSGLKG